jgi:acetyl esterase/lipase
MSVLHRIDPELLPLFLKAPMPDLVDLPLARLQFHRYVQPPYAAPPDPRVTHKDVVAPGNGESPQVKLRIFHPVGKESPLPCVFWTQGGGYVLTSANMDDPWCEELAMRHSCVVVSVDWRRAPEHPYPAASEDCYTGLAWVVAQSDALGIDPRRIVIGGHSSGGGSTASMALMVRDRGEFTVAHQLLIYPMIDDTNTTPSSYQVTDPELWNRACNQIGWKHFLGNSYGTADVSPYAAPARMKNLAGSIPASILTGELDLFRDENQTYAARLVDANVPVELHVYPGAPHGFDRVAPYAKVSRSFFADRDAILDRVFLELAD